VIDASAIAKPLRNENPSASPTFAVHVLTEPSHANGKGHFQVVWAVWGVRPKTFVISGRRMVMVPVIEPPSLTTEGEIENVPSQLCSRHPVTAGFSPGAQFCGFFDRSTALAPPANVSPIPTAAAAPTAREAALDLDGAPGARGDSMNRGLGRMGGLGARRTSSPERALPPTPRGPAL
jgi:hypothetical protein